jgi:flagellin-specific chaperone FliS
MMLYDGAIRFAEQARVALHEKNYEKSYHAISRCRRS